MQSIYYTRFYVPPYGDRQLSFRPPFTEGAVFKGGAFGRPPRRGEIPFIPEAALKKRFVYAEEETGVKYFWKALLWVSVAFALIRLAMLVVDLLYRKYGKKYFSFEHNDL